MDLTQLLQLTIDKQSSDLHLVPGYCPAISVSGELFQVTTLPIMTSEHSQKMLTSFLSG